MEQSLIDEGCRDPIIIWHNIIIDGHHRYEICKKHKLSYSIAIAERDFENEEEVKVWMLKNQMGRRNLTDKQRDDLIGRIYKQEKKTENFKGNQYTENGGGQNVHEQKKDGGQNYHQPKNENDKKTAERIAQQYGINEKTVRRNEKFAEAIDNIKENVGEEVTDKILSNKIPIPKTEAVKLAREEPETQKKIVPLFESGQAKKVDEAKRILSPEEQQYKENIKNIDKRYSNHKLVADLINNSKFMLINEEAVQNYMEIAIDVFQDEFVKNCDKVINKLQEMKVYHSNISKIRRVK